MEFEGDPRGEDRSELDWAWENEQDKMKADLEKELRPIIAAIERLSSRHIGPAAQALDEATDILIYAWKEAPYQTRSDDYHCGEPNE